MHITEFSFVSSYTTAIDHLNEESSFSQCSVCAVVVSSSVQTGPTAFENPRSSSHPPGFGMESLLILGLKPTKAGKLMKFIDLIASNSADFGSNASEIGFNYAQRNLLANDIEGFGDPYIFLLFGEHFIWHIVFRKFKPQGSQAHDDSRYYRGSPGAFPGKLTAASVTWRRLATPAALAKIGNDFVAFAADAPPPSAWDIVSMSGKAPVLSLIGGNC